jgi:hypothetical protein
MVSKRERLEMARYHVYLGKKRTTVTMADQIDILMALKLGQSPGTRQAHGAVRRWLQDKLDKANDPGRVLVSQWLQREAVLFLVDTNLSKKYDDWILSSL